MNLQLTASVLALVLIGPACKKKSDASNNTPDGTGSNSSSSGGFQTCDSQLNSDTVNGNGQLKTETRDLQNKAFNAVENRGPIRINVVDGQSTNVTVSADSNILPFIITEVVNNGLVVRLDKNICSVLDLVVDVKVPKLLLASQNGAGSFKVEALNESSFEAILTGAGAMELLGVSETANLTISGAGEFNAKDFSVKKATILHSGAGGMSVCATQSVDLALQGAGSIDVYCNPVEVKKDITGAGTITIK